VAPTSGIAGRARTAPAPPARRALSGSKVAGLCRVPTRSGGEPGRIAVVSRRGGARLLRSSSGSARRCSHCGSHAVIEADPDGPRPFRHDQFDIGRDDTHCRRCQTNQAGVATDDPIDEASTRGHRGVIRRAVWRYRLPGEGLRHAHASAGDRPRMPDVSQTTRSKVGHRPWRRHIGRVDRGLTPRGSIRSAKWLTLA
jgi:hypothetical protein